MGVVQKIFGTHSEREIKRIEGLVNKIESLRPAMMDLTDDQLRDKTVVVLCVRLDGPALCCCTSWH